MANIDGPRGLELIEKELETGADYETFLVPSSDSTVLRVNDPVKRASATITKAATTGVIHGTVTAIFNYPNRGQHEPYRIASTDTYVQVRPVKASDEFWVQASTGTTAGQTYAIKDDTASATSANDYLSTVELDTSSTHSTDYPLYAIEVIDDGRNEAGALEKVRVRIIAAKIEA